MIIPTLVKIFSISSTDKKNDEVNSILSDENKDKTSVRKLTEKTFDYLIWSFVNVSNSKLLKKSLFENNLHSLLISILTVENKSLNKLIWRILGNFACSEDIKIQILIDEGIITPIKNYLLIDFANFNFSILKEILFTISNIACGTLTHIQQLINNGIIRRVWDIISIFVEIDFNQFFEDKSDIEDAKKVKIYNLVYNLL